MAGHWSSVDLSLAGQVHQKEEDRASSIAWADPNHPDLTSSWQYGHELETGQRFKGGSSAQQHKTCSVDERRIIRKRGARGGT
jgi:hypothetical protein